jgi:hypothetical protein
MLAALRKFPLARYGIQLLTAAFVILSAPLAARELLTSDNAEFADPGRITFFAVPDSAQHRFSCVNQPRLTRVLNEFVIRIVVVAESADPMQPCHSLVEFDFGKLEPGVYTIMAHYAGAVSETKRFTFTVEETAKIVRAPAPHRPA